MVRALLRPFHLSVTCIYFFHFLFALDMLLIYFLCILCGFHLFRTGLAGRLCFSFSILFILGVVLLLTKLASSFTFAHFSVYLFLPEKSLLGLSVLPFRAKEIQVTVTPTLPQSHKHPSQLPVCAFWSRPFSTSPFLFVFCFLARLLSLAHRS